MAGGARRVALDLPAPLNDDFRPTVMTGPLRLDVLFIAAAHARARWTCVEAAAKRTSHRSTRMRGTG
jgi:hypothetical protein